MQVLVGLAFIPTLRFPSIQWMISGRSGHAKRPWGLVQFLERHCIWTSSETVHGISSSGFVPPQSCLSVDEQSQDHSLSAFTFLVQQVSLYQMGPQKMAHWGWKVWKIIYFTLLEIFASILAQLAIANWRKFQPSKSNAYENICQHKGKNRSRNERHERTHV